MINKKKIEELLAANEKQKQDKQLKLAEMAKKEQEEYIKECIYKLKNKMYVFDTCNKETNLFPSPQSLQLYAVKTAKLKLLNLHVYMVYFYLQ